MKYFGTDGIRGIPNEIITIEFLTKLGMALKSLNSKRVIIGTDTRISKDMLAYAIASGIMSRGVDVLYAEVIPTPALIYYSYTHQIIGVMITASHNPYRDNGIKIVNKGYKLTLEEEENIEKLIDNPVEYNGGIGSFKHINAKDEYVDFISKFITKTNKKICLDCANGATYKTAVEIFKKVTNQLVVVGNQPDGYNINSYVGSTHLDYIRMHVLENNCDIGFSYDGDGDRVLCVDRYGRAIDGDCLIYIIAKYLKKKNKLKDNKIVLTIMSNLGIIQDLKKNGIDVVETNVGDKYIIKELKDKKYSLGGENSGHIIFPEYLHTGDGVLISIIIIKILEEEKCDINTLLSSVHMYSDKMVNIKVKNKNKVINNNILSEQINTIKKELNNDCKIIVRASGTEEVIRVSVMAKDKELVEKYSNILVDIIKHI